MSKLRSKAARPARKRNAGNDTARARAGTAIVAAKPATTARAAKPAATPGNDSVATPAESARRYETIALVLQGGGALGLVPMRRLRGSARGRHSAELVRRHFDRRDQCGAARRQRARATRRTPARILESHLDSGTAAAQRRRSTGSSNGSMRCRCQSRPWPSPIRKARWPRCFSGRAVSSCRVCRRRTRGIDRGPAAASFYSTAPLKQTLEEFVDFDRINRSDVRFSVGAVNVRTGNFVNFDNYGEHKRKIRVEHVMASGALPPAFAAVEIDGEYYWDGGLVSNTPLDHVLGSEPRCDMSRVPGRPVARARHPAAQSHRRARTAERHPVFQPHAFQHQHRAATARSAHDVERAARGNSHQAPVELGAHANSNRGCRTACTTSST